MQTKSTELNQFLIGRTIFLKGRTIKIEKKQVRINFQLKNLCLKTINEIIDLNDF